MYIKTRSIPEIQSLLCLAILGVFLLSGHRILAQCPSGQIIYVNDNATGASSGTSWTDAYTDLQDALALASTCPNVTEIWVAEGTYYPDQGGGNANNDRTASFVMQNNLAIYGAFSGTESALSQRDWVAHPTILSGDIDQDGTLSNNSYHVILNEQNGLDSTAILDGFTITRGNANGSSFGEIVGGGMYNRFSSPKLANCIFRDNSADLGGGGMANFEFCLTILVNCKFMDNYSGIAGGGIANDIFCSPKLTNCIFRNNSAGGSGGAMYSDNSSPVITNCVFQGNSAGGAGGGGLYNINTSSPTLTNCILWENGDEIVNVGPSTATISFSIVRGGYAAGTNILDVDPLFVDTTNGDLRLLPCSPAIDAGTAVGAPDTDLEGSSRVDALPGPGLVDIGAYEFQNSGGYTTRIYVDADAIAGNNNGTTWTDAFVDLQTAILSAQTCGVDTIWVAEGTYYPDQGGGNANNDRSASFVMHNNLAIYGGFSGTESTLSQRDWVAHPTILSGDIDQDSTLANNSYHVIFNDNNGLDSTAILEGFTIAGGHANLSSSLFDIGGGMLNLSSSPHLINCTFRDNLASNQGGGMYNSSSSPILTNCKFQSNSADGEGGGMYNFLSSSPQLVNCSFQGNSADDEGGGMYNIFTSSPQLINCSFQGNSAGSGGGGLYNVNFSVPTLTNCILWENGDEIANDGPSTATVSFSIVRGGYAAGTNILDVNPLFVDAANGDLRLLPCSPAIDTGTAVGAPDTDLEGNPRVDALPGPGLVDIGAYEFQNSGGYDTRIYVDADAITGNNDGTTWADAFIDLQTAISSALACGVDTIWVAEGTYFPDQGGGNANNDRSASFVMHNNLAIYGGFSGTESTLSQRDWVAHPTILSGDIDQDSTLANNSYHVIFNDNNGLDSTAILGGFTVTAGHADGPSSPDDTGGGMYNRFSSPKLANCIFRDNSANLAGGGIYNFSSSPKLTNCIFRNDSAAFGGGMYNTNSSSPTITNCSFQGNLSDDNGGGMYNIFTSSPQLTNCSFQGNSAGGAGGGGLYNINTSSPTLTNCILWENGDEIVNAVSSTATVTFSIVESGYASGANILDVDPVFVDAANGDLRLLACSPAIDAGTSVGAPDTDLDGNPRVDALPGPGLVDIGAYEFQNSGGYDTRIYVDADAVAGNNDGTTWADAFVDLQTAILSAQTCGVDTIWVAEGTYYPDQGGGNANNDRSASFVMHNNLAIYGGFSGTESTLSQRDWVAHPTILSGDIDQDSTLANNSYHVIFNDNNGLDSTAILDGFTVTAGHADGPSFPEDSGGGMYNFSSSPKVSNCIFRNNSADAYGGGMYNFQASFPILTNCRFVSNFAGFGGGVHNDRFSSPDITNCIFRGNSARFGGGMQNTASSSPTITNCIFQGNSSDNEGGGMYNSSTSTPTLTNCILWKNGDEIVNTSSSNATVTFSIVRGGYAAGTNILDDDPLFVDTANGNLRLLACSPAIDAGTSVGALDTDLDGNPRVDALPGPGLVDIGAYEFQNSGGYDTRIYVDADAVAGNNDGTTWADAFVDLQTAILSAQTCGVDTIWVAEGTYYPDQGVGKTNNDRSASFILQNNLAIYGGFSGTESALSQRDWVAHPTILSGDIDQDGTLSNNSYHVIFNDNNALDSTAILDGFTITAGNADGPSILVSSGGGMVNFSSSPHLINCIFRGNSADGAGGGIFNNASSPILTNCIFRDNMGADGGGMYNRSVSSPILINCRFQGNSADLAGGGIYNNFSTPILKKCIFQGNSADNAGGGMYNGSTSPVITNCIFRSNFTDNEGGGLYNSGSSPVITNCSFKGNSAGSDGGGLYNANFSTPTLTNCILWENGNEIVNESSSNATVTFSIVEGGYAAGTNILDVNPLFVDAANDDLRLLACSPAIDAGTAFGAPDTDLEGNPRIDALPGPGLVDIGAYEFQNSGGYDTRIYVDADAVAGNNDGTTWADAFVDLQTAILSAQTCGVDTIWVAEGTYYPDQGVGKTNNDRSASFILQNNLAIYGGFSGTESTLSQRDWVAHPTILSGDIDQDGTPVNNSYHVIFNDTNGLDSTAILDGFTVTAGHADGPSFPDDTGSGMYNRFSSPKLANCIFRDNSANLAGGGMLNFENSSPILVNCQFMRNSVGFAGGGMANDLSSSPQLTNCIFRDNSADGDGGAMYVNRSAPQLINCSFMGNSADGAGGGLYNAFISTSTLTNCIFWENGDEIVNDGSSTATVSFSIVQGGYASGTNILDVDPLFVDASNGDLRLSPCSPAIDAGTTIGAPFTDLEGGFRVDVLPGPGIIDIGAYEFLDTPQTVEVVCGQATVLIDEKGVGALPAIALNGGSTGCGMLDFTVNNADTLYVDCTQVGTFSVTLTATDDRQQTGSATCSVTVIGQGNCPLSEPCSDTPLELNDDPIAAGIYRSTTTISSAGRIAGGTEVIMEAQQTISLQPPFQTEPNASFRARITNCNPLRSAATNEQELDEQAKAQETYEFQLDRPANRPLGPNELRVFPNPFRQQATVALRLAVDNRVDIQLFDMTGRLIATVWPSGPRGAGEHHFVLNVPGLQPGVYVLVVQIGEIRYNRRLTVIR